MRDDPIRQIVELEVSVIVREEPVIDRRDIRAILDALVDAVVDVIGGDGVTVEAREP